MTLPSVETIRQGQQQAVPEGAGEYRERTVRTQKMYFTYFTIVPKANSTLSSS